MLTLIFGIIEVILFIWAFHVLLVKKPWIVYVFSFVLSITVIAIVAMLGHSAPKTLKLLLAPFYRGSFVTVIYAIVMYLALFDTKYKVIRYLKNVRGQISIVAAIITLTHNVVYGLKYFPIIFGFSEKNTTLSKLFATWITLVLILLLIPLTITSFKCIRKRMKALTWKNIQKLAYPFYFLLYSHIMLVLLGNSRHMKITGAICYSIIFVPYFILRIRKAIIDKKS